MTAIKDAGLDKQPELYQKLSQGVFTLRDMYEQFQNVMKMGPLGKVMSMIPGMSAMMTKGREHESQARFKKFMTIMDSMTDDELDTENTSKMMGDSRILRIARGSGSHPQQVWELLEEFKRFQKMVAKMKHLKIGKNGEMPQMSRNPQQVPPLPPRRGASSSGNPWFLVGTGDAADGQVPGSAHAQAGWPPAPLPGRARALLTGGRQIGGMSGLQTLMKSMNNMDMSSFMGLPD
mmetsp:Transcript_58297/g.153370  ORF Transcript_58297/g.153370 Transcript_58297/m.153370 type:complete len:234 (-) Transcript_58297:645-1346(-)